MCHISHFSGVFVLQNFRYCKLFFKISLSKYLSNEFIDHMALFNAFTRTVLLSWIVQYMKLNNLKTFNSINFRAEYNISLSIYLSEFTVAICVFSSFKLSKPSLQNFLLLTLHFLLTNVHSRILYACNHK